MPSSMIIKKTTAASVGQGREPETVVLLHGLGRTAFSMQKLEQALAWRGYRVLNFSYPSTRLSIEEIAESHLGRTLSALPEDHGRVHFLTHSMGGIILRQYLKTRPLPELGRVVMLAPPNGGSEVAERLRRFPWLRLLLGPALGQLGTGEDSLPNRLGPVDFELGVIAGSLSSNPVFSRMIAGPDDGKVGVARTRVAGMRDFLVVPCCHTFIMNNRRVIDSAVRFIQAGSFAA